MLPQTTQAPTTKLDLKAFTLTPDVRKWADAFLLAKRSEGLTRTVALYGEKLGEFCAWCELRALPGVESLTPDDLRAWLLHLEETGHNAGGRHIYFRVLKTFLRWYWLEVEPQSRNPIERVKPPKLPEEALDAVSLPDVERLAGAGGGRMPERDKAIILTLADSGLRAAELCALDLEDLDPTTGTILVKHGKGGKTRHVFIGQKARRAVRAWLKVRGAEPGALFSTETGGRLGYGGLRGVVQRLAERVGIPEPPLHSFRRCFAINFLRGGGDLLSLQRLMGHAGLGLLKRYAKQNTDDLRTVHGQNSPIDRGAL